MPDDCNDTLPLPSARPPFHVVVALRVVAIARSFLYDARTKRRRMTAHHPAPNQWSSGSLPAIPASSLGSANEETDEPDCEHDQRDPPQHVDCESEPAEYEREQQHQQNGTHGLSPPCRQQVFPEFNADHLLLTTDSVGVWQQSGSKFANRSRRSSCHIRKLSTPSPPSWLLSWLRSPRQSPRTATSTQLC